MRRGDLPRCPFQHLSVQQWGGVLSTSGILITCLSSSSLFQLFTHFLPIKTSIFVASITPLWASATLPPLLHSASLAGASHCVPSSPWQTTSRSTKHRGPRLSASRMQSALGKTWYAPGQHLPFIVINKPCVWRSWTADILCFTFPFHTSREARPTSFKPLPIPMWPA